LQKEIYVARAPGRLDVMGGIADYSGSLVLQVILIFFYSFSVLAYQFYENSKIKFQYLHILPLYIYFPFSLFLLQCFALYWGLSWTPVCIVTGCTYMHGLYQGLIILFYIYQHSTFCQVPTFRELSHSVLFMKVKWKSVIFFGMSDWLCVCPTARCPFERPVTLLSREAILSSRSYGSILRLDN
jgi:hypothetical protein